MYGIPANAVDLVDMHMKELHIKVKEKCYATIDFTLIPEMYYTHTDVGEITVAIL